MKKRHYFFLNHYEDQAFMRCPQCDNKTKIGKFPLMIHIEHCQNKPEIIGNKYLVMGTLDKKDWREVNKNQMKPDETLKRLHIFKDVLNFKVIPAQWVPKNK